MYKIGLYAITTTAALCFAAHAATISAYEDPALFGRLNQADVNCAATACGPTAAINSFVFLEKSRPDLYGTSLTPIQGAGPDVQYSDLVAAANNLGTEPFMGSCGCVGGGNGTYIEDFIIGKQAYIDHYAPNTTVYEAQISIPWLVDRTPNPQPNTTAKKPSWVQDNTTPTAQFIRDQIAAGQDVEIFVASTAGAHYLTLTGISYDTVAMTGSIRFIDPSGGTAGTANITGLDGGANNAIALDYQVGGAVSDVFSAVAESPVPEPGTMLLTGAAFGLLFMRRRSIISRMR